MMHLNHSRRIMGLADKHNHPLRRGLLVFVLAGAFAAGALLSCGDSLWTPDSEKDILTGRWDLRVQPSVDTCTPRNVGNVQLYTMTLEQRGTQIEGELIGGRLRGSIQGNLVEAMVEEVNLPVMEPCYIDRKIHLKAKVLTDGGEFRMTGTPPDGFAYSHRIHGSPECEHECEARGTLYASPHRGNGNGNGQVESFLGGLNEFTLSPLTITDTCYGGVFLPFVPTETFQVDIPARADLPAILTLPLPFPLPEVDLPLVWIPETGKIGLDEPIETSLYIRDVVPLINCLLTADATGLLTPTSANQVNVLVEVFNLRFETLCPPGVPNCLPCILPAPPNRDCTISVSLQGTYVGE